MDMYRDIKFCIKLNSWSCTKDFPSNVGVKQGCVLSLNLFNTFLHDLPNAFDENMCMPVQIGTATVTCLMYADDLRLLSETSEGLQNALNCLHQYCSK